MFPNMPNPGPSTSYPRRRPRIALIEFASVLSMLLTAGHLFGFTQITWFHCFLPILICWSIGAILIVLTLVYILWLNFCKTLGV